MSASSFLSLVVIVQPHHELTEVERFVSLLGQLLQESFQDYEIILVLNGFEVELAKVAVPSDIRKNAYVLEFANPVLWDAAVMAGLQRANGDFVVNFDVSLAERGDLILQMYQQALKGTDIVYARGDRRWERASLKRRAFYFMLNWIGRRRLDPRARPEFMISRRALNWITQNRATSRLIKESMFSTGFPSAPLDVGFARRDDRRAHHESIELGWSTILRSTTFPLAVGRAAVGSVAIISSLAIADALLVRFFGFNLLLQNVEYVPGWAFLVVLVSIGFLMMSVTAYAALRCLYIILDELRTEPPYTVKRFGRL